MEKMILDNHCTRCKEPLIKATNVQRRLLDLAFVEMALDLGTGDRAQLLAALGTIKNDLEFLMDGHYECPRCGKSYACIFCGDELRFDPRGRFTACPKCNREYHFIDLEGAKKQLMLQYEAEMAASKKG